MAGKATRWRGDKASQLVSLVRDEGDDGGEAPRHPPARWGGQWPRNRRGPDDEASDLRKGVRGCPTTIEWYKGKSSGVIPGNEHMSISQVEKTKHIESQDVLSTTVMLRDSLDMVVK
ncbi:hypothetical protein TRIUR3_32296 [Triticum urartu]|uniref:Uncharacterized protein n=1 Tax=Triticum urartu TaxID=4572 RepID=M7YEQ5_TRIUA|nr:hypothetical protein TRIUR3_32296 [Triticum urartu]